MEGQEQLMAVQAHYDIFISYKNDSSGNVFAEKLAYDLKSLNYSVYFNSDERKSGQFDERIRAAVSTCKDFLLIVSQGCRDDLVNTEKTNRSWVRAEILLAKKYGVRITPLYIDNVRSIRDFELSNDPELANALEHLDGLKVPGDGYKDAPFDLIKMRLKSRPEGSSYYRDLSNGNPSFDARAILKELYEKAEAGDIRSMYRIGYQCLFGFCPQKERSGVVFDYDEAYHWLVRVSNESTDKELQSASNMLLGYMYCQGVSPDGQNYERGFEYYSSSDTGFSKARVAFMKSKGLGCDFDYADAEQYYLSILGEGDNITRFALASLYEEHGEYAKAAKQYESMEPKTPLANYRLGRIYARGNHVYPPSPNYNRAAEHYQWAMEGGNTQAALELGELYSHPTKGLEVNYKKAQECYLVAAREGSRRAQYRLGLFFQYGYVEQDVEKSIEFFEMAAEQGDTHAARHLAILYQLPEFCNFSLALKYCEMATRHGDACAEYLLGCMYLLGRGCDFSIRKGKLLLEKSMEDGFAPAQDMLELAKEQGLSTRTAKPAWL